MWLAQLLVKTVHKRAREREIFQICNLRKPADDMQNPASERLYEDHDLNEPSTHDNDSLIAGLLDVDLRPVDRKTRNLRWRRHLWKMQRAKFAPDKAIMM